MQLLTITTPTLADFTNHRDRDQGRLAIPIPLGQYDAHTSLDEVNYSQFS